MLEANNLNNFTGSIGPDMITDGLIFYNDYSNPKCYISGDTICNDLSSNQLIGTISGCTYSGNSLYFNGINSKIETNNFQLSSQTSALTFNIWYYPITASTSALTLINKGPESINTGYIWLFHSTLNDRIILQYAEGVSSFRQTTSTVGLVPRNQWINITITIDYNLKTTSFYKNSVFDKTNVLVNTPVFPNQNNKMYIGVYNNAAHYANMNSSIISVYNRALTQQEITQNYNALKGRFNL